MASHGSDASHKVARFAALAKAYAKPQEAQKLVDDLVQKTQQDNRKMIELTNAHLQDPDKTSSQKLEVLFYRKKKSQIWTPQKKNLKFLKNSLKFSKIFKNLQGNFPKISLKFFNKISKIVPYKRS